MFYERFLLRVLKYHDTVSFCIEASIICDRVCINGPLVGRYETEISAVKVNWSILVGFREIHISGSILHKEALDSHFKLISKLEISRSQNFSEEIKESTYRNLT